MAASTSASIAGTPKDIVRKSNYSDIFLVDLNGDVVYWVTKQAKLATNLLSGPYQSSGSSATPSPRSSAASMAARSPANLRVHRFWPQRADRPGGRLPRRSRDAVRLCARRGHLRAAAGQAEPDHGGAGGAGVRSRRDAFLSARTSGCAPTPGSPPNFSVENSFSPDFRPLQTPLIIKALSGEQGVGPFLSYHDDEVLAAYTQVKVFDTEWAFIAEISSPARPMPPSASSRRW